MNFSHLQHTNSSQLNLSHQLLADILPTIPPGQVKEIIKQECIDFNALLPDSFSVTPGSYSKEIVIQHYRSYLALSTQNKRFVFFASMLNSICLRMFKQLIEIFASALPIELAGKLCVGTDMILC